MPKANFTLKGLTYNDARETEAREILERLRWPKAVACPRCGSMDTVRVPANKEKKVRAGLYRCKDCRKLKRNNQFTVTVGTIFEDSHIKLYVWLEAIALLCSSKKGMSAHQLHRQLGITYKTAWFMAHRIRYAMAQKPFRGKMKGVVEADETLIGGKSHRRGMLTGLENKTPVISLVQRGGRVRSFAVETVSAATLRRALVDNVHPSSHLMTDELPTYRNIGKNFASHQTVNHREEEYVRGEASTNTVEGYFGLLKRGINGVYHHVSREHLHRYLSEFDFRYNHRKVDDHKRTLAAIAGFEGKRLSYK